MVVGDVLVQGTRFKVGEQTSGITACLRRAVVAGADECTKIQQTFSRWGGDETQTTMKLSNSPFVLTGIFGAQHATLQEFLLRIDNNFITQAREKGLQFMKFISTTRIAWLGDVAPPKLEPGPCDVSLIEVRQH